LAVFSKEETILKKPLWQRLPGIIRIR